MASFSSLPTELVVSIVENMAMLKDLSALARTDRKLYNTINPILYKLAVLRGDTWPLAWASHCGVAGTLVKALAAGADPNFQFCETLPEEEWRRSIAAARDTSAAANTTVDAATAAAAAAAAAVAAEIVDAGHEDIASWESDSDCDCNDDWSPETSDSDHSGTVNTVMVPSGSSGSGRWGHLNDSDRYSGGLAGDSDESDESDVDLVSDVDVDIRDIRVDVDDDVDVDVDVDVDGETGADADIEVDMDNDDPDVHTLGFGPGGRPVPVAEDSVCRRFTPLHLAACAGHTDIISILLSHGAVPDAFSENFCDCMPLYGLLNAAECPQEMSSPLWTPLHAAICHSHTEAAKLLLSHGASYMMEVNHKSSSHCTALHYAAGAGLTDLVSHIVTSGIQTEIDVRDDRTLTPLYYAYANQRWTTTIPALLRHGANISIDIKFYFPYSTITPLGEACRMAAWGVADKLVECGANVARGFIDTRSGRGLSPLHICCMPSARLEDQSQLSGTGGVHEDEQGIGRMRTITKLISCGAPLQAVNCSEDTPIIAAAQTHMVNALQALASAGADFGVRNTIGRTTLMQAVMGSPSLTATNIHELHDRFAQTIGVLLDGGARIDEIDWEGNTVLHLVFKASKPLDSLQGAALRLLLNQPGTGELMHVRNKDNRTPLLLAFYARNLEACEVLVRRGCCARAPIDRRELLDMFRFALNGLPEHEALLNFVLDLDTDRWLTTDPTLFSALLEEEGGTGTLALRAVQAVSSRGLPCLAPADKTRLLCQAIGTGDFALAYYLVQAGADVNATNTADESPLLAVLHRMSQHNSGSNNNNNNNNNNNQDTAAKQFIQALLDRGADVHFRTYRSPHPRPLTKAILMGREDLLILMLKEQPLEGDLRALGGFYLHDAVSIPAGRTRIPNEKIIDALLASGASVTEMDRNGDTPLSVLLRSLCTERSYTWRYHRYIKALLRAGVNVNHRNNEGLSIIDYLGSLMDPKRTANPSQTSFLHKKLQIVDGKAGSKEIRFLPRLRRRAANMNAAATTTAAAATAAVTAAATATSTMWSG